MPSTHEAIDEQDLDEFEETFETVDDGREPPPVDPPTSLDEAHKLMRRLARHRARRQEIMDTASRRIAAYKLWAEDRTAGIDRLIKRYEDAIEAWQRATGVTDNKTPFGRSTLRKRPASVRVVDKPAFIMWAMAKPNRVVALKIEPLVSQLADGLHLKTDDATDYIDGDEEFSAVRYLDDDGRPVPGVLVLTPKKKAFHV